MTGLPSKGRPINNDTSSAVKGQKTSLNLKQRLSLSQSRRIWCTTAWLVCIPFGRANRWRKGVSASNLIWLALSNIITTFLENFMAASTATVLRMLLFFWGFSLFALVSKRNFYIFHTSKTKSNNYLYLTKQH
jgi:hypothetical protein